MGQEHNHGHNYNSINYGRAFAIGVVLNAGFVVIEAVFGVLANSLALLADAGHNLSDVLGLLLAWGGSVLAQRLPSQRYTYGLRRSSILAALLNAVVLLIAVGGIAWEATGRFSRPEPISGGLVIGVAAVGVVINSITAWMFMSGRKHDLNIRGAYLHMAADAAVSLGVVLAGFAILVTGWLWLDPAGSLVIVTVITISTWDLLRESLDLALDAVPEGIDPAEVETYLAGLPGIVAVHDLHIWGISTTEAALTVHLVKPDASVDDALLSQIKRDLHDKFGIEHATVQFELGDRDHPCSQASTEAV